MIFLTKEDLLRINKSVIDKYGGTYYPLHNILKANQLDYLIEVAENNEIFGVSQYPTVLHVAALYIEKIATSHLFGDGNKRTALAAAYVFLEWNGYRFKDKLYVTMRDEKYIPTSKSSGNDSILEDFIQEAAQSILNYDDIFDFLEKNTEQK